MEYFFFDIRFPFGDLDGTDMDALSAPMHEWLGLHPDCAVLLLDSTAFIFQGFLQAPTRDDAFDAALELGTSLYQDHLGQEATWEFAVVRDAAEHLVFLNSGLRPDYQLSVIDLGHALEFTAAAIMRAGNAGDAHMFMVPQHHADHTD